MSGVALVDVDEGIQIRCSCPDDVAIHEGDQCILEADNITEFGTISSLLEDEGSAQPDDAGAKILRRATLQDQAKSDENAVRSRIAAKTCADKAEKLDLAMRLVRVRYSFDRKILTVIFYSEDRVDFREMVKDLAGELRTRVEMKQIGVRDEAGIVGGIGPCGRGMCCCTWLKEFESINVKMAKAQRLSLNPGAISGMCGRLKCCLRYECDQYREADRELPRDGATVTCPGGRGRVIDKKVLARRVLVRTEDDRLLEYDVDELEPDRSER